MIPDTLPGMTTCGIYARLSQARNDETATSRQAEDAEAYAARNGWEVVRRYADSGASGYTGKERAEFEAMLRDVEAREFDVLLVWKFDRLTRNLADYARFHKAAEAAEVRLIGVADGVDTGTPHGQLTATIMFGVARQESDNISVRVRRKNEENARAGKPHGGIRPFGYTPDRMSLQPDEAAIVRELYDRFNTGESLTALAADLHRRNVKGSQGKVLDRTRIRRLLANPRYAGLRAHRGEIVGPAAWEAIVTREDFEQTQDRLRNRPNSRQAMPRSYLLTGLLRCVRCDTRMVGHPSGKRRRYACPPPSRGGCGRMTIFADGTEAWTAAEALAALSDPATRTRLAGFEVPDEQEALRDLEDAEARQAELAAVYSEGRLRMGEWLAARDALEARAERARDILRASGGGSALADLPYNPDALAAHWEAAPMHAKRAVLDAVVVRVTIHPGRLGAQAVERDRVDVKLR